jgi:hypothetical protein
MRWIGLIILLVILASCTAPAPSVKPSAQCKWPEIPNDGGCCRDLNENGICDTIDLAPEISAEEQKEYEAAAERAQIIANRSGRYRPTIVNELYANASNVSSYRFLYRGDEIVIANGSIVRKLLMEYPLGDKTINNRRMKVLVNTVWLDPLNKKAVAQCVPPQKLVAEKVGTLCDNFKGIDFDVSFEAFGFKMPIKWLEEFLYRTPAAMLPGSNIGKRTTTIYKFTALNDSRRLTILWIDDLTAMPIRVEVWQGSELVEEADYLDLFLL